jgi:hypothetical protein
MDADYTTQPADPYNPIPGAPTTLTDDVRYISKYGFDWDLLKTGHLTAQNFAKVLSDEVDRKFWNIRGVQIKSRKVPRRSSASDGSGPQQAWQRSSH